jgi:hypothetical protein
MIIRTPKELLDEYQSSQAISQSELKSTLGGIHGYKKFLDNRNNINDKYYDEPADHFIIGSGVDHLITFGAESFNDTYYVSEITEKPSDTIMSIVKAVFDTALVEIQESGMEEILSLDNYRDTILESVEVHQWNKTWGADAKYNNIVKAGNEYFNDLVKGKGKKILSLDQYNSIVSISNSLVNNDPTCHYLISPRDNDTVFLFFQVPVYFTYDREQGKGLIDLIQVIIGRDSCTVKGFDVKTMSGMTSDFLSSYRKRRYDVQGAWYQKGITQGYSDYIGRLYALGLFDASTFVKLTKNVTVETEFSFLVESTNYTGIPMIYTMGGRELRRVYTGRKKLMYDALDENLKEIHVLYIPEIKGISEMLQMVNWYRSQGSNLVNPYVKDYRFNITWENVDSFHKANSDIPLNANGIEDGLPLLEI